MEMSTEATSDLGAKRCSTEAARPWTGLTTEEMLTAHTPGKTPQLQQEEPQQEEPSDVQASESPSEQSSSPDVKAADESSNEDDGDNLSLDDDPNVLKSEIDDIRKSVVSMSVGQPDRTTTIVKEWLEQPEPTPPAEPDQEAAEDPADGSDSEEKEK